VKSGDLSHYSDIIVDTKDDLKIKKNPRKNTQIELDNQFLLLIDTQEKNEENLQMNFVGYFSKTFWVFYGCFRWVLFYQVGGFLVGLCN
jgi:hypothetical protein